MLKDKLKELRESKGLTKKQVSSGCGISDRAYIAYEYGERDVSTETLSKLADFYGVTTDYLLGRPEAPAPTTAEEHLLELARAKNFEALEEALFEQYIELPEEIRREVIAFMYRVANEAEAKKRQSSITYEPMVARQAPEPLKPYTPEQDAQMLSETDPDDL